MTPKSIHMNPQVLVENVWKSFDRGRIDVLKGVSISIQKGEIVALCGASGCGKSTLLNVISGLEDVDRGTVRVSGFNVVDESTRIDLLRHHIGYVFQFHHLMPDLTLAENCLVPMTATRGKRSDAIARLHELASATGIHHRLGQRVRELSGGERQRGALVRARGRTLVLATHDPDLALRCDRSLKMRDGTIEGESHA